jgi:hypothetical protein
MEDMPMRKVTPTIMRVIQNIQRQLVSTERTAPRTGPAAMPNERERLKKPSHMPRVSGVVRSMMMMTPTV